MLGHRGFAIASVLGISIASCDASLLNSANSAPSADQVASAISQANLQGNSPLVQSLNFLANDTSALGSALGDALAAVLTGLGDLLNPELEYSYGQSPPVYPSRMSSTAYSNVVLLKKY